LNKVEVDDFNAITYAIGAYGPGEMASPLFAEKPAEGDKTWELVHTKAGGR
jgi:hypothetical protein